MENHHFFFLLLNQIQSSTKSFPSMYEYDIQDEMDVDRMFDFFQNIDYVIHCATVGGRRNKPETPYTFAANVTMFNNLIKHKDKFKKMIVFGSGAEKRNGGFPLDYYGLSKRYITQSIFHNNYECIILRLWGCFGKYETNDRFIKSNILRYINKEDIIVHHHKRMDFFYVNDIIPVIEAIFNGKIYSDEINLTYPDSAESLMEISKIINELDNYKVDITIESKVNIGQNYYNSEPTRWGQFNEINKKFIGLEKGITEVYNYIKNGGI